MESPLAGSFRDPAGHVFLRDGVVHRRIAPAGLPAYRRLIGSGLYAALVSDGLLVAHEELPADESPDAAGGLVLRPEQIPMVSYPYEWSLSQLRDAGMLTLRALRVALRFGMTLKDASAFNVQFLRGRPILIDTLSFDTQRGGAWVAYRQFCQHFYAPLLVAAARDPRLVRLAQVFIDGVPLAMASGLLPWRSRLRAGPLFHVHLHAKAEQRWSDDVASAGTLVPDADAVGSAETQRVEALADSLTRALRKVRWTGRSEWAGYYKAAQSYSADAFTSKVTVVSEWLARVQPAMVWDLGANTGHFSALAVKHGAMCIAFDADAACVDTLYAQAQRREDERVLPLLCDLANPSAAIGWAHEERLSLEQRGPADLVLALALIHHLAIGNNVPLPAIVDFLARLGRRAIVEFVPKSDLMVQGMLRSRADVFADYTQEAFERTCAGRFAIDERAPVEATGRVLYLLTRR